MNARVAPLWVARDRGFFAKYGVNADTFFVRGAPTLVAAMQSNEIDVGYTGGTAVVGAVANGADLKVLSAFTNRVTYDLMVKPAIKRPEDLRGKIFGIQSDRRHGMDGRHSRFGAFEARRGARQNQYYRSRRSKRFGSSAGSGHDRCDGAGRGAKPTIERAGVSRRSRI